MSKQRYENGLVGLGQTKKKGVLRELEHRVKAENNRGKAKKPD